MKTFLAASAALMLSAPLASAQSLDDAGMRSVGGHHRHAVTAGRSVSRTTTRMGADTVGGGSRIAPRLGDTPGNSGDLGAATAKQHQMLGN